jgi:hypothetical protein
MRYADTPTFVYLNDQAKVLNLSRWVKAKFVDTIDPDGVHVLAYAFPHGINPGTGENVTNAPQHLRTAWYVRSTGPQTSPGGRQRGMPNDALVALDVTTEEYAALPVFEDSSDKLIGDRGDGTFKLLPAIVLVDGELVDGRQVVDRIRRSGIARQLPVLHLDGLTGEQLAKLRASV